ncbi:MAG: hypothetical protein ACKVU0_20905 [Saprospiraceae bacterium]
MINTLSFIIFLLGVSGSCTMQGGKLASGFTETDTIFIAASQKAFVLEKGQKAVYIPLETLNHAPLSNTKPVRLLFENIRVDASGEGVYEVYLNRTKQGNGETNAANLLAENLVGTLNLYNLTIPNSPQVVSMAVSGALKNLAISDEPSLPSLSITVVFRGNIMPNQTEVGHTGQLYFGKVSIVQ